MHITLADIEGMASPGWRDGSSFGEVLDLEDENLGEVLDEPEQDERPDVKGLYTDGGQRGGASTLEICDLLKNVGSSAELVGVIQGSEPVRARQEPVEAGTRGIVDIMLAHIARIVPQRTTLRVNVFENKGATG